MALWKQFVHLTLFLVVSNWAFFALLCDVMSHTILPLTKAGGLWTICKIFSKIGALNQKKSKNADVNPPERRIHFNKGDTFLGSLELGTFATLYHVMSQSWNLQALVNIYFAPVTPYKPWIVSIQQTVAFSLIVVALYELCISYFLGIGSSELGFFCNVMSCYVTKLNYTTSLTYILLM